jgi:hypothetical protein
VKTILACLPLIRCLFDCSIPETFQTKKDLKEGDISAQQIAVPPLLPTKQHRKSEREREREREGY